MTGPAVIAMIIQAHTIAMLSLFPETNPFRIAMILPPYLLPATSLHPVLSRLEGLRLVA
jgi:hypothetical protein